MKSSYQELEKAVSNEIACLSQGIAAYNASFIKQREEKAFRQDGMLRLFKFQSNAEKNVLLLIPSVVNKAHILDLEGQSFIARLVAQGATCYLVDWGEDRDLKSIEDCLQFLRKHIKNLYKLHHTKINLVGYCMGGHFAALIAEQMPEIVSSIITIATPWDFAKEPYYHNFAAMLASNSNTLPEVISGEMLNMIFYFKNWQLINSKFKNCIAGVSSEFTQIEDWLNDPVSISRDLFVEILNEFILKNKFTSFISTLDLPILSFIGENDKIASKESCMAIAASYSNCYLNILPSGHLGMILNPKYKIDRKIVDFINV